MSIYGSIGFTRGNRRNETPFTTSQRKRLDVLLDKYKAISEDDTMDDDQYAKEKKAINEAIDAIYRE